jgi:outer membrane protein
MYKKSLVAGLALATLAMNATASQSLIETYEQAIANYPTLAISKLNAESAKEAANEGKASVLPTVTASAAYALGSKTTNDGSEDLALDFDAQKLTSTLKVEQNLFVLAAFTAYDALQVSATKAEMEAVEAEQDLMVTVAEKYIAILQAKDSVDVLHAKLEAVERQYEQTSQRYDVGLVTITDVLDAQATLDQTKVSLIRAEASYDITLQKLYSITGAVPESVKSISADIPIEAPNAEGQQKWVDYAVKNHPEILIAEKSLQASALTLEAQKQNRLPTVAGSFALSHSDSFWSDATKNDDEQNWSAAVGVTVSMNLYTGGETKAEIAQAAITKNIAEQNIELLKREKAVEVANLYRTVRADAQNVEAQKQVLKSSESALQATTVGYEVGTRNIVEVLDAQSTKFSAQNDLNDARYDYVLNMLKLKQAAGQLSLNDLQAIEQYLID